MPTPAPSPLDGAAERLAALSAHFERVRGCTLAASLTDARPRGIVRSLGAVFSSTATVDPAVVHRTDAAAAAPDDVLARLVDAWGRTGVASVVRLPGSDVRELEARAAGEAAWATTHPLPGVRHPLWQPPAAVAAAARALAAAPGVRREMVAGALVPVLPTKTLAWWGVVPPPAGASAGFMA